MALEPSASERPAMSRVKVAVCVQPLDAAENNAASDVSRPSASGCAVQALGSGRLAVSDASTWNTEEFAFDHVYGAYERTKGGVDMTADAAAHRHTRARLFADVGVPALDAAWRGHNVGVFAVGHSDASARRAMRGDEPSLDAPDAARTADGLLPRFLDALFGRVENERDAASGAETRVDVSFAETRGDLTRDLCARETGSANIATVTAPARVRVHSADAMRRVLRDALARSETSSRARASAPDAPRAVAAGAGADRPRSARSTTTPPRATHFVARVTLTRFPRGAPARTLAATPAGALEAARGATTVGEAIFVEPCGLERARADDSLRELVEAVFAAARGVETATTETTPNREKRETPLSRLARLCLPGGDAMTWLVAAVSPRDADVDATLATLRFASAFRNVRFVSRRHADPDAERFVEAEREARTAAREVERLAKAFAAAKARRAEAPVARASFGRRATHAPAPNDSGAESEADEADRLRLSLRDARAVRKTVERRREAARAKWTAKLERYAATATQSSRRGAFFVGDARRSSAETAANDDDDARNAADGGDDAASRPETPDSGARGPRPASGTSAPREARTPAAIERLGGGTGGGGDGPGSPSSDGDSPARSVAERVDDALERERALGRAGSEMQRAPSASDDAETRETRETREAIGEGSGANNGAVSAGLEAETSDPETVAGLSRALAAERAAVASLERRLDAAEAKARAADVAATRAEAGRAVAEARVAEVRARLDAATAKRAADARRAREKVSVAEKETEALLATVATLERDLEEYRTPTPAEKHAEVPGLAPFAFPVVPLHLEKEVPGENAARAAEALRELVRDFRRAAYAADIALEYANGCLARVRAECALARADKADEIARRVAMEYALEAKTEAVASLRARLEEASAVRARGAARDGARANDSNDSDESRARAVVTSDAPPRRGVETNANANRVSGSAAARVSAAASAAAADANETVARGAEKAPRTSLDAAPDWAKRATPLLRLAGWDPATVARKAAARREKTWSRGGVEARARESPSRSKREDVSEDARAPAASRELTDLAMSLPLSARQSEAEAPSPRGEGRHATIDERERIDFRPQP